MAKMKELEFQCMKCRAVKSPAKRDIGAVKFEIRRKVTKPGTQPKTQIRFRLVSKCPDCQTKMTRFTSRSTGEQFL